jgi:ring-1,2-phenylacetyl-CoA epoxidase subunit PaaC
MNEALKPVLAEYLIALGDDELILGHRASEWCGHAPILEEDIAFANIAIDEIGHANVWYGLAADLTGEDSKKYPDQLAFFRDADDFRSIQMVEMAKGDWAFTMLRQYLFDSYELLRLNSMITSQHSPLAEAAAKIRNEESYHHRHTKAWIPRLGLGTEESHQRMQTALDVLWPLAQQLCEPLPGEEDLVAENLVPSSKTLAISWQDQVGQVLKEANLTLPKIESASFSREQHTEALSYLLAEMQEVARKEGAGVRW